MWAVFPTLAILFAATTAGDGPSAPREGESEDDRPQLLVMSLRGEEGVTDSALRLLDELILAEFQKSEQFRIVGQTDIQSMVNLEMQKQLAGCTDETCLAEIGGALGVDRAMFGNLGALDEVFVLNLKIINLGNATVEARYSETVEGGQAILIDAARRGVTELLHQTDPRAPPAPDLPRSTAATDPPPATLSTPLEAPDPFYTRWWFWSAVGVAVGGAVLTVVLLTGDGSARDGPSEAAITVELPDL